jgi:hypothetical protein
MRGILPHTSPFKYLRIGWKGNSRAIVWTAWPAISLETMTPCLCIQAAVRGDLANRRPLLRLAHSQM